MKNDQRVSRLLEKLSAGDTVTRLSAIHSLEPFINSDPRVLDALAVLIGDPNNVVSEYAFSVLERHGRLTIEHIISALRHSHPSVRAIALAALPPQPRYTSVIIDALNEESERALVCRIARKLRVLLSHCFTENKQEQIEEITSALERNVEKIVRCGLEELDCWLARLLPVPAYECFERLAKTAESWWLEVHLLSITAFYGAQGVDKHRIMEFLEWLYQHREETRPFLMRVWGKIASIEVNSDAGLVVEEK